MKEDNEITSLANDAIQASTTTYRDFSQHSDEVIAQLHGSSSSNADPACNKKTSSFNNPFPVKLHYMLSEVEKDGLDHIVSWQPHGRCFIVHDQEEFVKQILPCWFSQSKISSFQRQLNLYGFRRLTGASDKGGYYHEYFLRSRPNLCTFIHRTKVKGTGARKPSSPQSEPNFYLMPYVSKDTATTTPASSAESNDNDTGKCETPQRVNTAPTQGGDTTSLLPSSLLNRNTLPPSSLLNSNTRNNMLSLTDNNNSCDKWKGFMSALSPTHGYTNQVFDLSYQLPLMAFVNNATITSLANHNFHQQPSIGRFSGL